MSAKKDPKNSKPKDTTIGGNVSDPKKPTINPVVMLAKAAKAHQKAVAYLKWAEGRVNDAHSRVELAEASLRDAKSNPAVQALLKA